jgi:hypothetical protein
MERNQIIFYFSTSCCNTQHSPMFCFSLPNATFPLSLEKHNHLYLERSITHKLRWSSEHQLPYTKSPTHLVIKTGTQNYLREPTVACGSNRQMRYQSWTLEHSKRNKKLHSTNKNTKRQIYTSFLRTGWLRTRLVVLGVGAKRWFVKKQSKKRATIAASPWRTSGQLSLPFEAPPRSGK